MTIAISGTTGITLDGQFNSASSMGFKNRLINSAMVIDQRNAGASVATSSGSQIFAVDRWQAVYSQVSKFTLQQNAASVLSSAPAALNEYQAITGEMASLGVRNMGNLNITVNNAGNVVSDADLVDQIRNGLLNSNLSGSPSAIGRLLGAFQ
jgi:hypothetical protein